MRRGLGAGLLVALACACRTAPTALPDAYEAGHRDAKGVVHTVERGQTLWRIARAYAVTPQDIAEANDVDDPTKIAVGQKLWIPGVERLVEVTPAPSLVGSTVDASTTPRPPASKEDPPAKLDVPKGRFIWPVEGIVHSRFGARNGSQHDGIDISAPKGTPVVAADAGQVLYAGVQRGYGNIVLIKHADELVTIYAHNDVNLVETGQRVKRGQILARVGQTGRATGPHLHFEVRQKRLPRNPLFFLPDPPK